MISSSPFNLAHVPGDVMALAFTDGKVALVNMTTTDIIRRYREHADEVHPAELHPLLEIPICG